MNRVYINFFLLSVFVLFSEQVYSQKGIGNSNSYNKPRWLVKDPFEQKVFIENNEGQFDGKSGNNNKILYSTRIDGVDIYFLANGVTYRHDEYRKSPKREAMEGDNRPHFFLNYGRPLMQIPR